MSRPSRYGQYLYSFGATSREEYRLQELARAEQSLYQYARNRARRDVLTIQGEGSASPTIDASVGDDGERERAALTAAHGAVLAAPLRPVTEQDLEDLGSVRLDPLVESDLQSPPSSQRSRSLPPPSTVEDEAADENLPPVINPAPIDITDMLPSMSADEAQAVQRYPLLRAMGRDYMRLPEPEYLRDLRQEERNLEETIDPLRKRLTIVREELAMHDEIGRYVRAECTKALEQAQAEQASTALDIAAPQDTSSTADSLEIVGANDPAPPQRRKPGRRVGQVDLVPRKRRSR